jgi:small-conductance mechanosensitive channel
VAAALAVAPGAALAQPEQPTGKGLPEPLTRDAIRELLARLSDAEARRLLIDQLDRSAVSPSPRDGDMMRMAGQMESESRRLRERLIEVLRGALALPAAGRDALAKLTEGRPPGHLAVIAVAFLAMAIAGLAAERLFLYAVRRVRRRLDEDTTGGLAARAGRLVLRLLLDLVGLAAFAAGALVFFFALYQGHQPTRLALLTYLAALVTVRVVAVVSRLLLAPRAPALRPLPFSDPAARRLHARVLWLAALYAFGVGTAGLLQAFGTSTVALDAFNLGLGLAFLAVALDAVWGLRAEVAALVRGPGEGGALRRMLADLWPVLATVYLLAILVARSVERLSSGPSAGASVARAPILSVLLLVLLPLADMALGRVVAEWLGSRSAGGGARLTGVAAYEPVLRRAVHIVVVVVGLLLFADLWGLDLFALAERGLGARISGALFAIAVTLLLAHLLWALATTAIDRRLAAEPPPGAYPAASSPVSRLRTLLPLLRMAVLVGIVVTATLSTLAAMGVNIVPLLAGAGVFGLAIGFGSQTLVRDIVSGAFFLMDDAFRLGEYIEVGDAKGTVEKITLRSLHLRHHRGAINVLPYGEIKRLKNTSRDWMILTMEFRLAPETDPGRVKRIVRRIGDELAADPELAPGFVEPLKSAGIMGTEENAIVLRVKFTARPGDLPWLIRREAYTRILRAFREEGIRFAHREVRVVVPPDTDRAAAAGAAAAAAGSGAPP